MDDLLSLRVAVVSQSGRDLELFREAASAATVPVEIVEADGAAAACQLVSSAPDLMFLDAAFADEAIAQVAATARAAAKPPFTVLMAQSAATPFSTDALAEKPSGPQSAARLLTAAIRVRLPCRVLIVDDSATMRSIVRKILIATRFPLEVAEVEQGVEAIQLARDTDFDIAFVDYNMPGFSGLETMLEIRREKKGKSNMTFVLMTSVQDEAVADRAQAQGAAFLRKPFFPADIEAVLCGYYGLLALNPKRA